jgi:hypothetical protein
MQPFFCDMRIDQLKIRHIYFQNHFIPALVQLMQLLLDIPGQLDTIRFPQLSKVVIVHKQVAFARLLPFNAEDDIHLPYALINEPTCGPKTDHKDLLNSFYDLTKNY